MQELEALIAKFPREARLGGVPTAINKIRAYVTFRASRKEIYKDNSKLRQLGDDYCWVIIYFLLRSGHLKEAVEYVNDNKAAFQSISRNFVGYLSNYARSEDRRLSRDYQMRIDSEYASWARGSAEEESDPYRNACYKIVGRCNLGLRQLDKIQPGVEDWMWLQFALAREVDRANENAAEVFGLDEVRAVVREIGQRHFAKGQPEAPGGHGTFFFLQILGGLFEEAVAYLYPYAYASAVHFAIALAHYGILRVSSSLESDTELRKWRFFVGLPEMTHADDLLFFNSHVQHQAAATDQLWSNGRLLHSRLPCKRRRGGNGLPRPAVSQRRPCRRGREGPGELVPRSAARACARDERVCEAAGRYSV